MKRMGQRSLAAKGSLWALLVLACGGEAQRGPQPHDHTDSPATSDGGAAPSPPQPGHAGRAGGGQPAGAGGSVQTEQAGAAPEGGEASAGAAGDAGGAANAGAGGEASGNAAGAAGQPPVDSCDPIVFDDAELELTVRTLLHKATGPLRPDDVAGFSDLTTESITSLKGVECLTDLTSLDVGSLPPGQIRDLGPLAALTKLETLSLARNPLASLEPLGNLPKLQTLYLFKVPVTLDLAPLAGAPALVYLDLEGDTLQSLAPLGSVPTLRELIVRSGTVIEPASIGAVTSLQSLDATGVFADAAPLASLTELQKLRIGHSGLANFSALSSLTKLKYLDASRSDVADIAAVASMTTLANVNLNGNQVSDVSPLGALPDLNLVVLVDNQIGDVAPLADNLGLGAGDFVYLGKNPFSCATEATHLQALAGRGADVVSDCP
jgi:hypothetical protein